MKLYLIQHGEALAKEVDPDRPLSESGKADVQRVARALRDAGVEVQRVMHSGKLRARQTAEILATEIAPMLPLEISDRINPNDNPGAFELRSEDGGVNYSTPERISDVAISGLDLATGPDGTVYLVANSGSEGGILVFYLSLSLRDTVALTGEVVKLREGSADAQLSEPMVIFCKATLY